MQPMYLCTYRTAELKQRKARKRLSNHHCSTHPLVNLTQDEVGHTMPDKVARKAEQKDFVETAKTPTKVSLQCTLCSFRTATLKPSRARQRLSNHQYSHILNIDQYTYSGGGHDDILEEEPGDDFELAREASDQEPPYIVINGDEEWLVKYGLMEEEITWEG